MEHYDERVDEYINKSAAFAQPILHHLRKMIHETCPSIKETIKWSFPHFVGKDNICSMASFKAHCSFGFWKASLMADPYQLFLEKANAMGQLGRIESLADLPPDKILMEYVLEALKIDESGAKLKKTPSAEKLDIVMPEDFAAALSTNPEAAKHYNSFTASGQRAYLEWVVEAKTQATRVKRIQTAMEWITDGKTRNWKYERK